MKYEYEYEYEYEYDHEHWRQLPAAFGLETHGMLLVHNEFLNHITAQQWTTITFLCVQLLQVPAIQSILEQRLGTTPQEARKLLQQLKPRERKVLHGLLLGQSTAIIAKSMQLSPRTVETYQSVLYQKLAVVSGTDAVLMALLAGGVMVENENTSI